jgi:hypothetical protein
MSGYTGVRAHKQQIQAHRYQEETATHRSNDAQLHKPVTNNWHCSRAGDELSAVLCWRRRTRDECGVWLRLRYEDDDDNESGMMMETGWTWTGSPTE